MDELFFNYGNDDEWIEQSHIDLNVRHLDMVYRCRPEEDIDALYEEYGYSRVTH